jgi:hypothetical protein
VAFISVPLKYSDYISTSLFNIDTDVCPEIMCMGSLIFCEEIVIISLSITDLLVFLTERHCVFYNIDYFLNNKRSMIKLSLCMPQRNIGSSRGVDPHILNFSTKWK